MNAVSFNVDRYVITYIQLRIISSPTSSIFTDQIDFRRSEYIFTSHQLSFHETRVAKECYFKPYWGNFSFIKYLVKHRQVFISGKNILQNKLNKRNFVLYLLKNGFENIK